MRRIGRIAARTASVVALAALAYGCGFGADTTLNRARQALAAGDAERAKRLVTESDAYTHELRSALVESVALSGPSHDEWPAAVGPILRVADATYRRSQEAEQTAIEAYLSERQLRRSRAAAAAADFAVERIVDFLVGHDAATLDRGRETAVEAALFGAKSLDPSIATAANAVLTSLAPAASEQLFGALRHYDATVRAVAVRHLPLSDADDALESIAALVGVESEFAVLYELPFAFGRFPASDASGPLAAMLALREDASHVTPSGPARAEAVAQLGRILRANSELRASYIPVVVAALSDEHDYVRSRAGDILVDLEADAIPPLLALATSGWRDAPLPVVSLLLPDVEADARLGLYSAAVRALTALSEPTVMTPSQREEFIRDLRETLDDNATAARGLVGLADVLGEFVAEGEPIIESTAGPTAYVGDVGEALEESPLRGNALLALAQLGRPGVDALLPYLEAPDAALRAATAAVLSTTGSVAAAERIAALCPRETDPESLTAMIVALAALDASAFAAQVEALLATADGRPDVLEAIAVALNVALEGGLPATAAMGAAALAGIARSDRLADELRREAVAALGRLAPAGVEVTLRDIMLDEHAAPMIRKAAARALGSMGARAEMALGAMEEMLLIRREDPDDFLRRLRKRHGTERQLNAAWGGLGWQAGYESLREVKVIPGLLRGEVARAYAALRGADANSLLADVLRDDQSASVRAAAASRLHGAATHTGALVRALRKDDSGSVRAAAAESLGSVGSARALKALRRAVRRDDYEQARVLAARGLGAQGGASEARGLAELLFADDEDEDTHTTATLADEITDALVALGDVATDVVVDGMDHADPDVRQAVARVLARSDDTKARARLRRALVDDASPRVRATVAAALGDRGSEDDAAALISVMSDPSEWDGVRVQAATSLGRIDSSVSEGVLRAQLGAARPQLRAAAASALGELRASGTVDDVAALVLDPDEPIATRVAATRALGKLGSGAARPLVTLAETDRGIVRAAAVRSLTTVDAPDAEAALRAIAASPFETAALRSLAMLGRGRTTQRARGSSAAR